MPFKRNITRRHRIPRARYRVTNWAAYEPGLRRRGNITLWTDEAALAGWQAPQRSRPGEQPCYSDLAIGLVLDSTGLELFGQGNWCAAKHAHQPELDR